MRLVQIVMLALVFIIGSASVWAAKPVKDTAEQPGTAKAHGKGKKTKVDPDAAEPIVEPVEEEPIVEVIAEPIAEPIVDPVTAEPIVEPIAEEEPVAEVISEPVVDPVVVESEPFLGAMYSYSNDIATAIPLEGAILEQQTVYIFWQGEDISRVDYWCCKGIEGDATGEAHNPKVSSNTSPFVMDIDISQLTHSGSRELYVDYGTSDGRFYTNNYTIFTVNITLPEPTLVSEPSPDPIVEPVVVVEEEPVVEVIAEPVVDPVVTEPIVDPVLEEPIIEVIDEPVVEPVATYNNIILSWVAPATRENGEALALSAIAGYEIYYTSDRDRNSVIVIDGGQITEYSIDGLAADTYHFSISAIDIGGLKSEMSEVISISLE